MSKIIRVNILGSEWIIEYRKLSEEPRLQDCSGFTDWTSRLIVIQDDHETDLDDPGEMYCKIIRHEIVHAFLFESGLDESSGISEAWATNEEMVDWIARQGPKIYKAWEEAGAV